LILDDLVLDAVEIGPILLPVVGVARDLDGLVGLELDELERTGADRPAPHLRGRHMAGIDRREARGEQRDKGGLPALELEGHLEVAVGRNLIEIAVPGLARIDAERVAAVALAL